MLTIDKVKLENFGNTENFEIKFNDIVAFELGNLSPISDIFLAIKYFLKIGDFIPNIPISTKSVSDEFNEKLQENSKIEIEFCFNGNSFVYILVKKQEDIVETITDKVSGFVVDGYMCVVFLQFICNPFITAHSYISSTGDNMALYEYYVELNEILYKLKTENQIYDIDCAYLFDEWTCKNGYKKFLEEFNIENALYLEESIGVFVNENGVQIVGNGEKCKDNSELNSHDKKIVYLSCFLLLNKLMENLVTTENKKYTNCPLILSNIFEDEDRSFVHKVINHPLIRNRQIFVEGNKELVEKVLF